MKVDSDGRVAWNHLFKRENKMETKDGSGVGDQYDSAVLEGK